MTDNFKKQFNIIKFAGSRKKATITVDGKVYTVYAKDHIYCLELNYNFPVPDYGSHFIFEFPVNKARTPAWLCTCGSYAVYVGSMIYRQDASPQGAMIVCFAHANTGKHADSFEGRPI